MEHIDKVIYVEDLVEVESYIFDRTCRHVELLPHLSRVLSPEFVGIYSVDRVPGIVVTARDAPDSQSPYGHIYRPLRISAVSLFKILFRDDVYDHRCMRPNHALDDEIGALLSESRHGQVCAYTLADIRSGEVTISPDRGRWVVDGLTQWSARGPVAMAPTVLGSLGHCQVFVSNRLRPVREHHPYGDDPVMDRVYVRDTSGRAWNVVFIPVPGASITYRSKYRVEIN